MNSTLIKCYMASKIQVGSRAYTHTHTHTHKASNVQVGSRAYTHTYTHKASKIQVGYRAYTHTHIHIQGIQCPSRLSSVHTHTHTHTRHPRSKSTLEPLLALSIRSYTVPPFKGTRWYPALDFVLALRLLRSMHSHTHTPMDPTVCLYTCVYARIHGFMNALH